jgi:hypothetical protein
MTDQTLLMFGGAVTFIFIAGVYVFVRQRYERASQEAQRAIDPMRAGLRDARSET